MDKLGNRGLLRPSEKCGDPSSLICVNLLLNRNSFFGVLEFFFSLHSKKGHTNSFQLYQAIYLAYDKIAFFMRLSLISVLSIVLVQAVNGYMTGDVCN